MSGFNPSGRKEDFSVKLRAQNMKNVKDTNLKLDQENRKMEERLRELKMAMGREKEARERQGGGFWNRGQTGTLNNYATDVLKEKTNKEKHSGKKRVKVLQDEPLDLPKRNAGPGTMKYIAQRNPQQDLVRDGKNKGAKCGQCEDRAASLTCVQCSESYCAGCFAAFHLKGALKRHRSVPLHVATGPRQCMTPRSTPPTSSRSAFSAGASSGEVYNMHSDRHGQQRGGGASGSSDGGSPGGDNPLLDGAYNEADSAAFFQQALVAWRTGDNAPDTPKEPPPTTKAKPRKVVVKSPDKSHVRMVEHSTSTAQQSAPEVKSAAHSLSYAQRLLLKQHRRTELGHMDSDSSVTPSSGFSSVTPRLGYMGPDGEFVTDDGDEERVDFASLYQVMTDSSEETTSGVPHTKLVVTDVTHSPKEQRSTSAESSSYTVQEVSSMEAWQLETQARLSGGPEEAESPRAKRLSKSRETTRVIQTRIPKSREVTRIIEKPGQKSREVTRILDRSGLATLTDSDGLPLDRNQSSSDVSQVLSSARASVSEMPTLEEGEGAVEGGKPPGGAGARTWQRPKSSKSRAASARPKSARSRPASRAQSRAASRMKVEGTLTKTPSTSLAEIARRGSGSEAQYQSPLGGFFMAGVKVKDQVDDPNTPGPSSRPASARPQSARPQSSAGHHDKIKVSNKLYAMAPRSWRPDSSLGEAAAAAATEGQSGVNPSASPEVMRYTYSGQLHGQPLQWNPHDNLGTPVPSGENLPATTTTTTPTPTPPPTTPGSSRQRRKWRAQDPSYRPFSAARAETPPEDAGGGSGSKHNNSADSQQQKHRPHSSTGGLEPAKKGKRQMPAIDKDLDGDERERARRQKSSGEGWAGEEEEKDPLIRQFSASRTRSWVASQNSINTDSNQWEDDVEEFGDDDGDEDGVTPRPQSQSRSRSQSQGQGQRPVSARSSVVSRSSKREGEEESGRTSRAIVMDGEDLSKYDVADHQQELMRQNTEDCEALDTLEYELAAESGRLTADGQISRLSRMDVEEEDVRSSGGSRSRSSSRRSYDQGYDIATKLRDDELSDGENEQRIRSSMDQVDEEAVRALR